jgi:DinB family protein
MQRIGVIAFATFAAVSSSAPLAQSPERARAPIGRVVDLFVTETEHVVVPAADALPEPSYDFTPSAGAFAGVRSFADQVKHLAAANYELAARALGEQPPAGTKDETAPASVKTKAQIMDYLRGSFESLHRAAARITVQNAEDPLVFGGETQSGVGLVIGAIAHAQNHYGQLVEYLRMNHIVPPASR